MLYQRRSTLELAQVFDVGPSSSDETAARKISHGARRSSASRTGRKISKAASRRASRGGELNRGMLEEEDGMMAPEELEELEDRLGEMVDPRAVLGRHRRHGLHATGSGGGSSSRHWPNSLDSGFDTDLASSLLTAESAKAEEDERRPKQLAKLILPHVALVLLTCCYTLLGALLFFSVEHPNELRAKRHQLDQINQRQERFVTELVRLAASNMSAEHVQWERLAREHLHEMSDLLFWAFEKHFLTSQEVKRNTIQSIWTFSTAVFFSVTVVSTIGYGNPVPVTRIGRVACISFSLFGIPLTLVTIADLGKFLSEHLVWLYGKWLQLKHYLSTRRAVKAGEHVCRKCRRRGVGVGPDGLELVQENRIPALLVLAILVLYTALGGLLMSQLEPWSFFTSFYWSFITMTTVGFGDLMPRRDHYTALILLYIILGLAITTMCIDLVGVQYIRKIHYFGRKIQDARSALAVVGGKVVLVSELYSNLVQRRHRSNASKAFVIENLYVNQRHIIPFIPADIRTIRFIDQPAEGLSRSNSLAADPCRFCQSMANHI